MTQLTCEEHAGQVGVQLLPRDRALPVTTVCWVFWSLQFRDEWCWGFTGGLVGDISCLGPSLVQLDLGKDLVMQVRNSLGAQYASWRLILINLCC